MEAKINVSMSPAEFDLLRKGLHFFKSNEEAVGKDRSTDPALRREANANAVQTADLLAKLQ